MAVEDSALLTQQGQNSNIAGFCIPCPEPYALIYGEDALVRDMSFKVLLRQASRLAMNLMR